MMKRITFLHLLPFLMLFFSARGIGQEAHSLQPVSDAHVYSGDKTTPLGEAKTLVVHRTPKSTVLRHTFIKFDLSSLRLSGPITSATLKIYCTDLDKSDSHVILDLFETDTSWEEKSLIWTGAPKPNKKIGSIRVEGKDQYVECDMTDYVRTALANGLEAISLRISDSHSTGTKVAFNSKESGSNVPILEIF